MPNNQTTKTEIQVAMDWLLGRDTGLSSKALMARMLGATLLEMDWPRDPDDLGRCLRLLEAIPTWRARLGEMAQCGPVWAALVARWDDLEKSMLDEVGIRWEKARCAPKTYSLMKEIQNGV